MTSEFGPKYLLIWKRGSSFVSTEDENLWNPSRLMWFDELRIPERSLWTPPKNILPSKKKKAIWRELCPNSKILFINVCLHLKGYAIEICIGMDLGLLIQI